MHLPSSFFFCFVHCPHIISPKDNTQTDKHTSTDTGTIIPRASMSSNTKGKKRKRQITHIYTHTLKVYISQLIHPTQKHTPKHTHTTGNGAAAAASSSASATGKRKAESQGVCVYIYK
jgi:hypothetical protein